MRVRLLPHRVLAREGWMMIVADSTVDMERHERTYDLGADEYVDTLPRRHVLAHHLVRFHPILPQLERYLTPVSPVLQPSTVTATATGTSTVPTSDGLVVPAKFT